MRTEFVRVAAVGELADGAMTIVSVGGQEVLLIRVGDTYFAVAPICSHAFGYLDEGTLYSYEVECPVHQGRFDVRTGQPTRKPPEEPISSYSVRVEGDAIYVGPLK